MISCLEVISSLQMVGGSESFSLNFSRFISEKSSLTVVVLYEKGNQALEEKLDSIKNIKIFRLNKQKHIDVKTIIQLRQIIKKTKFDFIHSENNCLITLYFALRPLKRKPIVLHTLHLPGPKECPTKIKKYLYKKIFHSLHFYPIALSDSLAIEAQSFYGLTKIDSIPNGVDIEQFSSHTLLKDRPNDVTIMARLTPQKNYPFVLRIFEELTKIEPAINCFIYGQGEQESEIKETIKTKSLENVHFMGTTSTPEKIMGLTKIFLLGSSYEANPMSINEAMASGCVVISSAVDGVPEIVNDKKDGFLFTLDSPLPFAKKIVEIYRNPSSFQYIADEARKTAQSRSFDKVVDSYVSVYQSKMLKDCE